MTNPTRQEIINAYNTLEALCARLPATRAAKESILKALPPKPQPTMAEVEWDDNKHYLAEAENPDWGKVIMLGEGPLSGLIRITLTKENGPLWQTAEPETLTPTGKRYALTEVQDNE